MTARWSVDNQEVKKLELEALWLELHRQAMEHEATAGALRGAMQLIKNHIPEYEISRLWSTPGSGTERVYKDREDPTC